MSAGDLRFYHAAPGDLADTLIAAATGGPSSFVHVEIDMGDGTAVGELLSGLHRFPLPTMPAGRVVSWPTSQHTGKAAALVMALHWAADEAQAAPAYGWEDITDAALHVLAPSAPAIVQPGLYDCSDFVTRFLLRACVHLPFALASEPHTVTPEALAAALGVS